jgi:hypothetical protein
VTGPVLLGALLSVLAIVLGSRDQRALWLRWEAHRHANPAAAEPSAQEFARRGAALVVLGICGVLTCAVIALTALVGDLDRRARTDAALAALVAAVEAEPLPIGCPSGAASRPGCRQPRDAVTDRAGPLPRIVDQRVVEPERLFRLDLDLLPDGGRRCLEVRVTGPIEQRVLPGGPQSLGGRTVDTPDVALGPEASVTATVLDGACGA